MLFLPAAVVALVVLIVGAVRAKGPAAAAAAPPAPPPPTPAPAPRPAAAGASAGELGAAAAGGLATAALGAGAGVVVAAVAATELRAAEEILSGHPTAENVATVAFFPVAVTATAVNAVADLFGWRGHPLGEVRWTLLAPFDPSAPPRPEGDANVPPGAPIYALDAAGTLHHVERPDGEIRDGGWSWREVVAVNPAVVRARLIAGPVATIRDVPMADDRPRDAAGMRERFGSDAVFRLGAGLDLYGPWNTPEAAAAAAAAAAAERAARDAAAQAEMNAERERRQAIEAWADAQPEGTFFQRWEDGSYVLGPDGLPVTYRWDGSTDVSGF